MTSAKQTLLTKDGYDRIKQELFYLKGTKRMEIAKRIKQAISFGDISENSEYDEAKNEQADNEAKISKYEKMIRNAVIIDEDNVDINTINIGSFVKLFDKEFNEEVEYQIVGSAEANPSKNKISNESPVGSSLIGKKVGDDIIVAVPNGEIAFKVLDIHK